MTTAFKKNGEKKLSGSKKEKETTTLEHASSSQVLPKEKINFSGNEKQSAGLSLCPIPENQKPPKTHDASSLSLADTMETIENFLDHDKSKTEILFLIFYYALLERSLNYCKNKMENLSHPLLFGEIKNQIMHGHQAVRCIDQEKLASLQLFARALTTPNISQKELYIYDVFDRIAKHKAAKIKKQITTVECLSELRETLEHFQKLKKNYQDVLTPTYESIYPHLFNLYSAAFRMTLFSLGETWQTIIHCIPREITVEIGRNFSKIMVGNQDLQTFLNQFKGIRAAVSHDLIIQSQLFNVWFETPDNFSDKAITAINNVLLQTQSLSEKHEFQQPLKQDETSSVLLPTPQIQPEIPIEELSNKELSEVTQSLIKKLTKTKDQEIIKSIARSSEISDETKITIIKKLDILMKKSDNSRALDAITRLKDLLNTPYVFQTIVSYASSGEAMLDYIEACIPKKTTKSTVRTSVKPTVASAKLATQQSSGSHAKPIKEITNGETQIPMSASSFTTFGKKPTQSEISICLNIIFCNRDVPERKIPGCFYIPAENFGECVFCLDSDKCFSFDSVEFWEFYQTIYSSEQEKIGSLVMNAISRKHVDIEISGISIKEESKALSLS